MISNELVEQIVNFVKSEPRTVQDISGLIGKSWVTADSYLAKIESLTGRIKVKTFRKGSHGALKVVYYNSSDSLKTDDLKSFLFDKIKTGRRKQDFDFLDVYQYVADSNKRAFIEHYNDEAVSSNQHLINLLRSANERVLVFSGNLSFLNIKENGLEIYSVIESLLEKKVSFKILSRVNLASTKNLDKIKLLQNKYPNLIEVRHSYNPLRGFIIDDKVSRFKNEENQSVYKVGELDKNTRIFYEITDNEWNSWLEKIFWNLFKNSIDYDARLKDIKKLF